ncbi:hypothetical protein ACLKA6_016757 [Drosophila palustris]
MLAVIVQIVAQSTAATATVAHVRWNVHPVCQHQSKLRSGGGDKCSASGTGDRGSNLGPLPHSQQQEQEQMLLQ